MAESEHRSRADELARLAETDPSELRDHVEELGELLTEEGRYVRGRALRATVALSEAHPDDAVGLVDPLTDCLGDEHLRDDAALALGNVAIERPSAVAGVLPALVATLDDEGTIRVNATFALASIAEADPEALAQKGVLDRLFGLLEEATPEARTNVTKALGEVAGVDPKAVCRGAEELGARLDDDAPDVRKNAAYALGTAAVACPDRVAAAAGDLVELLDDPDPEVRAGAAYALGYPARLSPGEGEATVEALLELVDDGDPAVRQHVTYALSVLAEADPEAVRPRIEPIARRVVDERGPVRRNALRALASLDEEYPEAVTAAREDLVWTLENLDARDATAAFDLAELRGLAGETAASDELRTAAERAVSLVESGAVEVAGAAGTAPDREPAGAGGEEADAGGEEAVGAGPGKVFCPNCGETVDEDGTFCPSCGEQIE